MEHNVHFLRFTCTAGSWLISPWEIPSIIMKVSFLALLSVAASPKMKDRLWCDFHWLLYGEITGTIEAMTSPSACKLGPSLSHWAWECVSSLCITLKCVNTTALWGNLTKESRKQEGVIDRFISILSQMSHFTGQWFFMAWSGKPCIQIRFLIKWWTVY